MDRDELLDVLSRISGSVSKDTSLITFNIEKNSVEIQSMDSFVEVPLKMETDADLKKFNMSFSKFNKVIRMIPDLSETVVFGLNMEGRRVDAPCIALETDNVFLHAESMK